MVAALTRLMLVLRTWFKSRVQDQAIDVAQSQR
jgi:hypothetical protein